MSGCVNLILTYARRTPEWPVLPPSPREGGTRHPCSATARVKLRLSERNGSRIETLFRRAPGAHSSGTSDDVEAGRRSVSKTVSGIAEGAEMSRKGFSFVWDTSLRQTPRAFHQSNDRARHVPHFSCPVQASEHRARKVLAQPRVNETSATAAVTVAFMSPSTLPGRNAIARRWNVRKRERGRCDRAAAYGAGRAIVNIHPFRSPG
jgi:hypothetical protein